VTAASAPAPVPSRGAAAANDAAYSRPGEQGVDYVDNVNEAIISGQWK